MPRSSRSGVGPIDWSTVQRRWHLRAEGQRGHTGGAPRSIGIEIVIERDPAIAIDTLAVGRGRLDPGGRARAGRHRSATCRRHQRPRRGALDRQWGILFNVRPGPSLLRCPWPAVPSPCASTTRAWRTRSTPIGQLARDALSPLRPGRSPESSLPAARCGRGQRPARWCRLADGDDGIRVRDGVRLSSHDRGATDNVDLFTFANDAAEQLVECGIELIVEELDLTGDTMLNQLLLPERIRHAAAGAPTGPRSRLRGARRSSRHASPTEENQADENPSGFTSDLVDHLIASARESHRPEAASEALRRDPGRAGPQLLPYWPLWYDSATSAVSGSLWTADGPIDPATPRYDWDISSWTLDRARG